MTFDDNNPSASSSDFSVTSVTYSNSPSFSSGPTYSVQANGSASGGKSHWKVVVSGTVAETGNYTVTVNVADVDGSTVSSGNTTLAVADAALSNTTPANSRMKAIEGNAIRNLALMNFDDNNPSASSSDF